MWDDIALGLSMLIFLAAAPALGTLLAIWCLRRAILSVDRSVGGMTPDHRAYLIYIPVVAAAAGAAVGAGINLMTDPGGTVGYTFLWLIMLIWGAGFGFALLRDSDAAHARLQSYRQFLHNELSARPEDGVDTDHRLERLQEIGRRLRLRSGELTFGNWLRRRPRRSVVAAGLCALVPLGLTARNVAASEPLDQVTLESLMAKVTSVHVEDAMAGLAPLLVIGVLRQRWRIDRFWVREIGHELDAGATVVLRRRDALRRVAADKRPSARIFLYRALGGLLTKRRLSAARLPAVGNPPSGRRTPAAPGVSIPEPPPRRRWARMVTSFLTVAIAGIGVGAGWVGVQLARTPEVVEPPSAAGRVFLLVDRPVTALTVALEVVKPNRPNPAIWARVSFSSQVGVKWMLLADRAFSPVTDPERTGDDLIDISTDPGRYDLNRQARGGSFETTRLRVDDVHPVSTIRLGSYALDDGSELELGTQHDYTVVGRGEGAGETSWFARDTFATGHRGGLTGTLPSIGLPVLTTRQVAHQEARSLEVEQNPGHGEGVDLRPQLALDQLLPGGDALRSGSGPAIDWHDQGDPWPASDPHWPDRRAIDALAGGVPRPVSFADDRGTWYAPQSCSILVTVGTLTADEQLMFTDPATAGTGNIVAWRGATGTCRVPPVRWTTTNLSEQNRSNDAALLSGILLGAAVSAAVTLLQLLIGRVESDSTEWA